MTNKELLESIRPVGDILEEDRIYLAIIKKSKDGIAEVKEQKELMEQELMQWVFYLGKALLAKKKKNKHELKTNKEMLTLILENKNDK